MPVEEDGDVREVLRSTGGTIIPGEVWRMPFWFCGGGFLFGGIVMRRELVAERFVSLYRISFAVSPTLLLHIFADSSRYVLTLTHLPCEHIGILFRV